jgi:predicted Zn-dependent peptidase
MTMRSKIVLLSLACATAVAGAAPGAFQPPRPPAVDRSRPPQPGPPKPLVLPRVDRRALSNGLPVWIAGVHEVPVVHVTVVVRSGATADPHGRPGLASLTADMLDEGAGGRDALALADEIALLGAELTTSSGYDASSVGLHVPVARLDRALPILADVVLRPDFPAAELERLRKERLTAILQARDDPARAASSAFPRVVYGERHRYGLPASGTTAGLQAIGRDDLARFHRAHYRPENAAIIVVGDVRAEQVLPAFEQAFGGWRAAAGGAGAPEGRSAAAGAPAPQAALPPPPPVKPKVVIVDRPGAAQSQVRVGGVGVPRSTPDYFPILVLNTILGGSFTSRLNQNLREQHGYAYGARSVFEMRRAAGPFVAAAGVQTDKTAEALREIFKELEGIRAPVPAEELERAKNYLALGLPRDFETTRDIAARLAELFVYDLPEDFYRNYVPRLQAVTAADVARVARQHIDPRRFVVVVAGDRKVIEAPVRALGIGPVELLPIEQAVP